MGSYSADLNLPGPTDSISATHGNGYNICGDLVYTLTGENAYTKQYMVYSSSVNSNLVDDLKFKI